MPVQTMQAIAEHSLFKAALPIICAALIGSITWIFVTVMDLDKTLHRVEQSEIPQINADITQGYKKIDELEKLYEIVGSYETLFNKRSRLYNERGMKNKNLTENDYKKLGILYATRIKIGA